MFLHGTKAEILSYSKVQDEAVVCYHFCQILRDEIHVVIRTYTDAHKGSLWKGVNGIGNRLPRILSWKDSA